MTHNPKIALGAWSWGQGMAGGDQIFGNHLFEKELRPVFDKAMELGLSLWDTAAVYGEGTSEKILGSFLQDKNREDFTISTKFTPQIANNTETAMEDMLEGSMERLHISYADIYWIHNPANVERWTKDLIPLLDRGLVKAVGVSNHNLSEIKRADEILKEKGYKVSAVQNHYSLLHRSSEKAGILQYCADHGITFYAYMVLEQGVLTGAYDVSHPLPENSQRGKTYNKHLEAIKGLVAELSTIGKKYDVNAAQIAIAWAIAKGTLPIVGVTKVHQVEEAYGATQISLTEEEICRLEKLGDEIGIDLVRRWEKDMAE